jgi:hypothetical protein
MQNALDGECAKCIDRRMTTLTIKSLVGTLGGVDALASICGVPRNTAASWVHRRRIPGERWLSMARSDAGRSMGLTVEMIAEIHASERAGLGRSFDLEPAR